MFFNSEIAIRAWIVFFCVFVLLSIFVFMQSKMYEARTLIRFSLGREFVYVPETLDAGVRAPNPGTFTDFLNAEILLLDNPELVHRAIRAVGFERAYPTLVDSPDGLLLAALALEAGKSIELITGSFVVKVAVRHPDPVLSAALTNELVNAYFDWRREFYIDYERVALRARLSAAIAEADRITAAIKELLGDSNPLAIETELQSASQSQVHLTTELRDAEASLSALRQRQTEMQDHLGLQSDRMRTTIEAAEIKARMTYLEGAIADNLESIERFSKIVPELRLLQRRQNAQIERIANIQIRLQDSELSEDLRTQENVRVIQAAVPPIRAISMPRRLQLMIAAAVAGLAAAAVAFVSISFGGGGATSQRGGAGVVKRDIGDPPLREKAVSVSSRPSPVPASGPSREPA